MGIKTITQGTISGVKSVDQSIVYKGRSPYIGSDGYWYVWDDSTQAYANTGVQAGLPPHTHPETDIINLTSDLVGKQPVISDLAEIRSGASKGSTAVQDESYVHTDNNYSDSEKVKLSGLENYDDTEIKNEIGDIASNVSSLETKVSNTQEKLIAGDNITIAADGKTISASGGGGSDFKTVSDAYAQYYITGKAPLVANTWDFTAGNSSCLVADNGMKFVMYNGVEPNYTANGIECNYCRGQAAADLDISNVSGDWELEVVMNDYALSSESVGIYDIPLCLFSDTVELDASYYPADDGSTGDNGFSNHYYYFWGRFDASDVLSRKVNVTFNSTTNVATLNVWHINADGSLTQCITDFNYGAGAPLTTIRLLNDKNLYKGCMVPIKSAVFSCHIIPEE